MARWKNPRARQQAAGRVSVALKIFLPLWPQASSSQQNIFSLNIGRSRLIQCASVSSYVLPPWVFVSISEPWAGGTVLQGLLGLSVCEGGGAGAVRLEAADPVTRLLVGKALSLSCIQTHTRIQMSATFMSG